MLKRKNRLVRFRSFKFQKSLSLPFCLIRIRNNGLEDTRFGFVISKNIDKRAVARNRMKRVLRSCAEQMLTSVHAGHDMLFILKKNILDMVTEDIYRDLKNKFQKEGYMES